MIGQIISARVQITHRCSEAVLGFFHVLFCFDHGWHHGQH